MTYDGAVIANFILDFCEEKGRPITHISLQKILYFCHVWSLIQMEKPLVRQRFEAWDYGPVLQHIYREFKGFDSKPIDGRAKKLNPMTGQREVAFQQLDTSTEALLSDVIEFYSRLSSGHLVELSHVEGGPWEKVWNHKGVVNPGMQIDDEEIRRYYSSVESNFCTQ